MALEANLSERETAKSVDRSVYQSFTRPESSSGK